MQPRKLAFITYETPFAPSGGIAAVMARLPGYVQQASGLETVVITPFHHRIEKTNSLQTTDIGVFKVPMEGKEIPVKILKHQDDRYDWPWYFLQPVHADFFNGFPHPYRVSEDQKDNFVRLLRDSLFFGNAVARALEHINSDCNWTLLLQDWEAATTALAMAGKFQRHQLFLTLHNSYDVGVKDMDLVKFRIHVNFCPGDTVLSRAIPLVERPVFTVSDQFALDLTSDIFQVHVMADHLQALLLTGLVGINNGPFETLRMEANVLENAMGNSFDSLRQWKISNRQNALKALTSIKPSKETPVWGNLKKLKRDEDSCWFVMAGRDDPRQKGYDIAAEAIRLFLEAGGQARFFFFPIPGDEGLPGLIFLKHLAEAFPESVLTLPFMWKAGYFATLRGASFGIMPSLYEPFGGANEFYLNGTVGIGRATGGLLQQVVPLWAASSFSHAVQWRAQRWHTLSAAPTGLLFREKDEVSSAGDDWNGINEAGYDLGDTNNDRVAQRRQFATFSDMASELCLGIKDAVHIYQDRPNLYYRMIRDGITYIQNSFAWERAAQAYVRFFL